MGSTNNYNNNAYKRAIKLTFGSTKVLSYLIINNIIKESFNIIYFDSKTNSKIIISLDTYTTQNLKQLL